MRAPPQGVARDHPLARLTTIGTGGSAEYFARPRTLAELERLLFWAADEQIQVGVLGSGSNLLIADDGVRGLVIKLDGELSAIALSGQRIRCGAGARLPALAARAARAGLAGLEFGVSIPGTIGGAVRMNANAYGGELARVLEEVVIASAAGVRRCGPEQLGFSYRRSNLAAGEVVAQASFALASAAPEQLRAVLATLRERRREAQPSGIRTFGSTFKNPADGPGGARSAGQLLDAAGCRGLQVGGARFSIKHANFIENLGQASSADVLALMAEGRRRVRERFGVALEAEVQLMGDIHLPGKPAGT